MSETLQNLEKKELVVKISGQVTASNIEEFQESANSILSSINTELVTDQDFQEARNNIKSCKAVEIHIDNAKQHAINSVDDISKVMLALDKVKADFANIRIQLTNADKKRSQERKQEIIQAGIDKVEAVVKISTVKHAVKVNTVLIADATKNKKTFSSMEESVAKAVENQIEEINSLESRYSANMAWIEEAELQSPGIFPDKKTIALKDPETVSAEITARIEKQKRELREKEERETAAKKLAKERAEAKAKAEEERIAAEKIEADNLASFSQPESAKEPEKENTVEIHKEKSEPSPFDNIAADPFSSATFESPVTRYKFTIVVDTTDVTKTIETLRNVDGCVQVKIEVNQ